MDEVDSGTQIKVKETWQEGLEGNALEIVKDDSSRLCVQAGPGTGKSYCMTRRVLRFIQQQKVTPGEVLAITFTRTAASDLRRTLESVLPKEFRGYQARTLHSLCNEILKTDAFFEARGRVPRVLLTAGGRNLAFEAGPLLKDMQRRGHPNATEQTKKIKQFEAAWAKRLADPIAPPVNDDDAKYNADLRAWLAFHRCMLIGELVPLTYEHLYSDPENPYRGKFRAVLVDEFQDLNKVDQEVIDLLAGTATETVVGDLDQSIFSFRYAHPEGLVEFARRDGVVSIPMDRSRRCPKTHLEISQASIKQNTKRSGAYPSPLDDAPRGMVYNRLWADVPTMVDGIVAYVKHVLTQGIKPGDILVMTPARPIGIMVRKRLVSDEVADAQTYFTEEALDTPEAQQGFTLLTLAVNQKDRVALRTWLGSWKPHQNAAQYEKLWGYCEEKNLEPWDVLSELAGGQVALPAGIASLVLSFKALLPRIAELKTMVGQDLLDDLFPPSVDWAEEMRASAGEYIAEDIDATDLHDILLEAMIHPVMPTEVNHVRIMSVHKAKGLTCKASVVAGIVQGLLPRHYNPAKTDLSPQEYLEEQRRLFYVATTRSSYYMLLCRPRAVDAAFGLKYRIAPGWGNVMECKASQFLTESGSKIPPVTSSMDFLDD